MPSPRRASLALVASCLAALAACSSSSSSSSSSGSSGTGPPDASAPGTDGGPSPGTDGGPSPGTDGGADGGLSTNACGTVGGSPHWAIAVGTATQLVKLFPGADSDVPLGRLVGAGGASLVGIDLVVADGKVLLLATDSIWQAPISADWLTRLTPPTSGSLTLTRTVITDMPQGVRFVSGDATTVFAVTTGAELYAIDVGQATATLRGQATLPPECTLVDFAARPASTANVFQLLATCSSGAKNRVFALTVSTDGQGQPVSQTAPSGDIVGVDEALVGVAGNDRYTESDLWAGAIKKRPLRECAGGTFNPFRVTRVEE